MATEQTAQEAGRGGETGGPGAAEQPALLSQSDLQWGPAPDAFPAGCELCVLHGDPGARGLFSVRLRASQRYVFAPHAHPHDEHVTVISGRLELGNGRTLDRRAARVLGPGDYAFLPRDQFHFAWAGDDETVFQVEAIGPFGIVYANPADDPRAAPAAH